MVAQNTHRHGSIYVLTLLTVAAVGSMVLIGVTVRSASSTESTIIEQVNENSDGMLSAAELALAQIDTDEEWVSNAQKGAVFSQFTLGERTYSSTVIDADTLATPDDDTLNYRVTIRSESGVSSQAASIDLTLNDPDYLGYLQSLGVDAYWALNEAPKSSRADDPVDGRDGEYLDPGIAGAETNDEGGVVPLFANNGDHVETPYDSQYSDDTHGTVSFWVKLTGSNPFATFGIFGQRFETDGMPAATIICTSGSLMAYMDDSGNYDISHSAATPQYSITVGQWHHVAMTWGSAGLSVYIDGSREAHNASCTQYWDTRDGFWGWRPLMIGAGYIPGMASQTRVGFEGSIAHFAILTDQLGPDEVAELAGVKPDLKQIAITDKTWARVYE